MKNLFGFHTFFSKSLGSKICLDSLFAVEGLSEINDGECSNKIGTKLLGLNTFISEFFFTIVYLLILPSFDVIISSICFSFIIFSADSHYVILILSLLLILSIGISPKSLAHLLTDLLQANLSFFAEVLKIRSGIINASFSL